jgi:hypothetical protein
MGTPFGDVRVDWAASWVWAALLGVVTLAGHMRRVVIGGLGRATLHGLNCCPTWTGKDAPC